MRTTTGGDAMEYVDKFVFGSVDVPTIIRKERGVELKKALKGIA